MTSAGEEGRGEREPGADPGGEAADRRPGMTLQLVEQGPEIALVGLRKREIDLAPVHGYTVLPRDFPPGCEEAKLLDAPVLLALHPDRASRLGLAAGEPVGLAACASAPWLVPAPVASCYEMIQRACGAAGFVPRIRARSSDFSVLTALAAADALPGGPQLS
ncbi:LysR substrate-binding domain-containing protein [Streptomyces sp. NPDC048644]|uniref:LysR substrate-binding domain-containing protein n=1 Tax=Streptomyces sp. NPDC048644 TaxID=3365582 RepID=UPI003719BA83